jgi:hypothetical protein
MATTTRCRSCRAEIFWAATSHGKRMPVDAQPVEDGNLVIAPGDLPTAYVVDPGQPDLTGEPRYTSHFASCPHADQHRRPR